MTKFSDNFTFYIALCLTLALYVSTSVNAHSYLTSPEPYTSASCAGCSVCPRHGHKDSLARNPRVFWRRGQNVEIKWARNNHNAGFVRLGLVPAKDAFNVEAHEKYAFYYGCWEQGLYKCDPRNRKQCAVDRKGLGHRRTITIPDSVPDGVYAFSFIWYGGSHYLRKMGKFSDYSSCVYVSIQGGNPLSSSFQPFFDTGSLGEFTHKGLCLTSAVKPGDCRFGCDHTRCFYSLPQPFLNGARPRPVSYVNGNNNNINTPRSSSSNDKGICKDGVCCSSSCGVCQQLGCRHRPGGFQGCCPLHIVKTGMKCHNQGAPCYETGRGRKFQ